MEENKTKKGKKYLVIGVLVLFLSILGASVSYYLARVQGTLTGRAAGTELTLTITKLSTSASMDLIPLDNDLETLNLASLGYGNNTEEFDATKACIDINGYSVCQIYKVRVTNNGTVPLVVNGTVTLSGQNVPNIDCAKMDDEVTVTNNASCKGGNVLANSVTLAANSYNDYYIMVYINNLDEPQYDSGTFNGTIVFTTEDGRKVKGRFTRAFNLAEHITNLYNLNGGTTANPTAKTVVTNNEINYNYATNVGLMNDRLGGTTTSLDGGNIRYYGASPNNYIDIGDKLEIDEERKNWEAFIPGMLADSTECNQYMQNHNITDEQVAAISNYSTVSEFCSTTTIPAGTPILWRIIGVFDGKVRIRRDESIGQYLLDISSPNINNRQGVNEWSQADLMKLLNSGYENNSDKNHAENDIIVNNSLYWNSESGYCYQWDMTNDYADALSCDFTSSGLSDEAKEYIVDQTIYLGGFDRINVYSNQAYTMERGTNVFDNTKSCYGQSNCNDGITRSLSWTGKIGLIYPSDFGYASDFGNNNCQNELHTFSNCTANWMAQSMSWTISPWAGDARSEMAVSGSMGGIGYDYAEAQFGGWPTLLLDASVVAESGNGSKATPYVLTS